jgi:hypothetical protein
LWKGILGSPVFLSRGNQERLTRLWRFVGVPLPVEKTHSPPTLLSLCPSRASTAIPVRRMERLALAVFGDVASPVVPASRGKAPSEYAPSYERNPSPGGGPRSATGARGST